LRFFEFSRWPLPPSWIFVIAKFYWLLGPEGGDASACQILSKSVNRLQTYEDFSIFQDGGRPPSWICLGHISTTHSEYLRVSITLQNLVVIDAVVFII